MKKFKVTSVEVITWQIHDLLLIKYVSSHGYDCESLYKFKDNKRHKRSMQKYLKTHSPDFLMYNIKNVWNDYFVKCKCWRRFDWQLMFQEPVA